MSDPKKNFVCPKCGHVLNDMQRPWGDDSVCPFCRERERSLKLSKKIPARVKTVHFRWAYKHWCRYTKVYRVIREKLRGRRKASMCKCDWCGHKFEFGDWIALAQPMPNQEGPKRNWVLCVHCADILGAKERCKKGPDKEEN